MKKHFAGFLLIFAGVLAFCQNSEWKEYTYAADNFAVTAPAKPESQNQAIDTAVGQVQAHNYFINLGDNAGVLISVTDFGKDKAISPRQALQGAKNGSLKSINGKLISEKEISLQNYAGLEFEMEAAAYRAWARYYIVEGKLVAMMSVAPQGKPFASETGRLFESLRLNPKN